jgi:hypothetical protein
MQFSMQLAKGNLLSWLELGEIAIGLVQCANFLTGPVQQCGHRV